MSDTQISPIILDAEQTLRLSLQGVKLIEASAGTGKTYAISNLYLRFVLAGFRVSQILVVTFTNAATEELRGRIRKRLYEAQRCLEPSNLHSELPKDDFLSLLVTHYRQGDAQALTLALSRLQLAVRCMEEATIFTINGFCQRALTDHAFSSGQAFRLDLIRDDDSLWQDALKDWWRRTVYPLNAERLALFNRVFPSLDKFLEMQSVLRNALDKRLVPDAQDSIDHVYRQWHEVQHAIKSIAQKWAVDSERFSEILRTSKALSRTEKTGYRLAELEVSLQVLSDYFKKEQWFEIPSCVQLLSTEYMHQHSTAKKLGTDPSLEDPFFRECERLWLLLERVRTLFRLIALHSATEQARAQIETKKRLTQTLTYHDQLSRLRDGLEADGGERLAAVLRSNFPVAMIDEFQDTDDLQYGIFRRIYLPAQFGVELPEPLASTLSLIMIGDPKQAIYSFRGGDIFAYAKARGDVGEQRYTLATNWRSVPALISAVNAVFLARKAPFVYDDIIEFQAVLPASKPHSPLRHNGQEAKALTFWQFGIDQNTKPIGKSALEQTISNAVADEIASLVLGGRRSESCLGDTPLLAGDIAVLVRTSFEGNRIRQALQARGIGAVSVGRDTVFESAEAQELFNILQAVVHYQDRSLLRVALSSALLGLDYGQIANIVDTPLAWLDWMQQMRKLNSQWTQRGFMAMFYSLLQHLALANKLARQADSERRLTNLLHLGELLQQTSRGLPGFEALLRWFQEQLHDNEDEETQLRLESDEALVKIVTIHASKGLEYPVVFVPFLWASKPRGSDRKAQNGLPFHDEQGRACIALDKDSISANLFAAEKERLAEDVRLVYVALTRARAKLYCVWGAADSRANPFNSAFTWLLLGQQKPEDLETNLPYAKIDFDNVAAALTRLAQSAEGNIECLALPENPSPVQARELLGELAPLEAQTFSGTVATDWRISSFSSLTRDVHQPPIAQRTSNTEDAILQFTAGAQVGLFLHDVLENLDFQGDINAQAIALNKKFAKKYGFVPEQQEAIIIQWLRNIVTSPLNDKGLCLAMLAPRQRLNELEFDLAIGRVEVAQLNRVLKQWAGRALVPLSVEDFRGMVTGFIDLVFAHEGRFYIADYKSNLLGLSLSDYAPEALAQAVFDRRYDLQYLLYILALHRYLQQRVPNYHYDQHMGGAYYLFLRGMRPEHGPRYGVHFDLPPRSLIETLDTEIFGRNLQAQVLQ